MGIPLYFKTLSKEYPEIIIENIKSILSDRTHLFFDLNCAIHPCCRTIMQSYNSTNISKSVLENRMNTEIILYMKKIIELVNPSTVFIAIDGVAPFSKMSQQRQRRYKSILTHEMDTNIRTRLKIDTPLFWDTNAISPGTHFMNTLAKRIIHEIDNNSFSSENTPRKIIFSSADEPGEGEHKILDYLRTHYINKTNHSNKNNDLDTEVLEENTNPNILIYGLDADLIMLAMSSKIPNIYLLRESLLFNKPIKDTFLLLDIDSLKIAIIKNIQVYMYEYDPCYKINDYNRLIDDYIFVCFLLGNDFIPHIPGLSLKEDGHDYLLKLYISILINYKEYLIDTTRMKINNAFLFSFFNKLSSNETTIYQSFNNKRAKMKPYRNKNGTQDPYEIQNELINNLPITDKDTKHIEHRINIGFDKYKSVYYKECFGFTTIDDVETCCENYIRGIHWVFYYYFNKCISWRWKYNYRHPPLLSDISKYLSDKSFNINYLKYGSSKPLQSIHQLLYILPPHSKDILPDKYRHIMNNSYLFPIYFGIDMIYKRYFWQTQPILPDISYNNLKKMTTY